MRETPLAGVLCIEPLVHADERGFFLETYNRNRYREAGVDLEFVQDNHSRSGKGVLRGFHYQDLSAPMAKLVRCVSGAVLDAAARASVAMKPQRGARHCSTTPARRLRGPGVKRRSRASRYAREPWRG